MELEEWQLDTAQLAIVNESECNAKITEMLTDIEVFSDAEEVVAEYIFSSCDEYLQDLLTEEQKEDDEDLEFVCSRAESCEIAVHVLAHFGWYPQTTTNSKPEFSIAAAINFITSNDKESKEIAEGLEEFKAGNKASCETFNEWLQIHIHGGMDSFLTKCFGTKISTTEVEAQDIVLGLLAYFPEPNPKSYDQLQEEINEHVGKAGAILQHVENQIDIAKLNNVTEIKNTNKENIMAQTVIVKTIHYVNGNDVNQMSSDQLHNAMKELEAEIKDLKNIKAKSKSVKRAIKNAKTTLAFVVKHADAKIK